jgi:glycosyltransferase involved in cell wall biosynthesis
MVRKHIPQAMNDPDTPTVLIVVASLAAEGTPRLVPELSRVWMAAGIQPIIAVMHETPDDLRPDFDALGVEYIKLAISHRGYVRYVKLAYKIFTLARQYRACALLSMPLGWHTFMAMGARLAGVRRIIAHVGNYPNASANHIFSKFRLLVQLGRPFTDHLICCSRYVREGTERVFGIGRQETAVVYNGLPLNVFARTTNVPRIMAADDEPIVIGMVARLEQHKDQPTLIRAARILKERGRIICIWLIGEGSRRPELERLIDAEGVADIVDLLGMRRDVLGLVNRMHLFAFSTTPDEGLGIALIEAMAAGVPIAASDVGACREVLDNGESGYLVRPGDPLALADAIDAICSDAWSTRARAVNARRKVFREFCIEDMAWRYAALLEVSAAASRTSDIVATPRFAI